MRCLIIGAGIGGTTAAIALRRAGVDVLVCERAPEPREVGAGIAMGANAMMALASIGAADAVATCADPITSTDLLDWRGRLLIHTPVADIERDLPNTSVLIHRADLLNALLSCLPHGTVQFGRQCTGFVRAEQGVRAQFAHGKDERADILIGADGIRSAVRAEVLGDEPPRYSGYTGWRGIAHGVGDLVEPARTCEFWGPRARFGYGRCGKDRVYWYATQTTPEGGRDEHDPRPALLRIFGDWVKPIPQLIERTQPSAVLRNDIIDRPPSPRWGSGCVSLLGDAAHPTTPNLGQGACMAIEDAVVLAQHLKDVKTSSEIDRALRAYEQARIPRTAMITRESWKLGRMGQWGWTPAMRLRDALLARLPRSMVVKRVKGIVGYRAGK